MVSDPVVVLTERLVGLLQRPTYVLFSGGVDSSLLLALCATATRSYGLPDPIPITYRYPAERTRIDEEFQDLVIESLELCDWVVIQRDAAEVIGPDAARAIAILGGLPGVMTAPAHLAAIDVAARSPGSVLITGEGGDETFGPQLAAVPGGFARSLRRNRRRPSVAFRQLQSAWTYARSTPRPASMRDWYPWLTDEGIDAITTNGLLPPRRRPWRRLEAIDRSQRRGYVLTGLADIGRLGAHQGVEIVHPLMEDTFVRSLVACTPRHAFTSRAALVERLWPGVVPRRLLERRQKAIFNEAYVGDACRAFAKAWDGSSLASPYIDNEVLRTSWLDPERSLAGGHLLQAAWAAQHDLLPPDSP